MNNLYSFFALATAILVAVTSLPVLLSHLESNLYYAEADVGS